MEIELPDGTILEAPDDADPSVVARAYLGRRSAPASPSGPDSFSGDALLSQHAMAQLAGGAESTVTPTQKPGLFDRITGYGKDYLQGLQRAGDALGQETDDIPGTGIAEMLGTVGTGLVSPIPAAIDSAVTGTPYREARDKYTYKPQTQSGRAMVGGLGALTKPVGDAFGFAAEKAGNALDYIPGVSSEGAQEGGAALTDALGLSTAARTPVPGTKVAPKKPAAIPSTAELKQATDAAYAQARDAGVVVQPQSFTKFVDDTTALLNKEHLNAKLHSGTSAALEQFAARAKTGQPVALEELDQLRQIVRDAPKDKGDGRMARKVVQRLDAYIEGLSGKDLVAGDAPVANAALKQARELNGRLQNSSMFDELLRKAGVQAGAKFTQAGEEHALRSQFKAVALRKDFTKKFTAEEQAAIEKVAKGGSIENVMRDLGKLDPLQGGAAAVGTSVLSGTAGGLGFLMGGPEGALLSSMLPAAVGIGGRRAATNLTRKNVEAAHAALVGRGLPTAGQSNAPSSAAIPSSIPPALLLSAMLGQRRRP